MSQVNPTALLAIFCLLLAHTTGAQNAPSRPEGTPEAIPQVQGPTIHATANEVALDLVVRDKKAGW